MSVGERIQKCRIEKGISAAELARRAKITKSYLSEIESGGESKRPSGEVLFRLAEALGTTIADLLGKRVQVASQSVPPALKEFAAEAALPAGDVRMLASIRFRGNQPQTVSDWRYLYESIRRSVGPSEKG